MSNIDQINYSRLGQAQTFYKGQGYINLATPWTVSQQAVLATLPPGANIIQSNMGSLVGSGEQGFIQMMLDGTLPIGKFQTTTPCFRDEKLEPLNPLTKPYFMKTELIWHMPEDPKAAYQQIVNDAMNCFFELSDASEFAAIQTEEGIDITFHGIELGSYGIRQLHGTDHVWVYGTGLAEPRFSMSLQLAYDALVAHMQRQHDAESSGQNVAHGQDIPNPEEGLAVALATNE